MFRLKCPVQQYEWGKLGSSSAVASLASDGQGIKVENDSPYAEFWFGTHQKGPAQVVSVDGKEKELQGVLESSSAIAGLVVEPGKTALPYLFKVLSVAKALSIQAHPDKKLAEELHASRPDVYKDDNHKPEMAIAVTPFEAMCGFRSVAEIAAFLKEVPELATLIGEEGCKAVHEAASSSETGPGACRAALKAAFGALVARSDEEVGKQVSALVGRLTAVGFKPSSPDDLLADGAAPDASCMALRLNEQFPLDVGVFAPFLLNLLRLQPGQGVFLAANEPHAYLAGDCVECMACSDNVVRAGLTPKLKDKDTLVSMLTYAAGKPPVFSGGQAGPNGEPLGAGLRRYAPPVPEFEILRADVRSPAAVAAVEGAKVGAAGGAGAGAGEGAGAGAGEGAGAGAGEGAGAGAGEGAATGGAGGAGAGSGGSSIFACGSLKLPKVPSAAIVLVIDGSGMARASATEGGGGEGAKAAGAAGAQMLGKWGPVSRGQVWLQSAGTELEIKCDEVETAAASAASAEGGPVAHGAGALVVYRVHVNADKWGK